jgi:hypothetical protein
MKQMLTTTLSVLLTLPALASGTAPMNIAERSAYRLESLISKGSVPKEMASDLSSVQISTTQIKSGVIGYQAVLSSPSNDSAHPNTVTLLFGLDGKPVSESVNFTQASSSGPMFTQATGATLLDLGAEAIVDHLAEDPSLVQVATLANLITLSRQSTAQGDSVQFNIHLNDGRIFQILMDLNGNLLGKSFLH